MRKQKSWMKNKWKTKIMKQNTNTFLVRQWIKKKIKPTKYLVMKIIRYSKKKSYTRKKKIN